MYISRHRLDDFGMLVLHTRALLHKNRILCVEGLPWIQLSRHSKHVRKAQERPAAHRTSHQHVMTRRGNAPNLQVHGIVYYHSQQAGLGQGQAYVLEGRK